ncbi:hypothetical protein M3Y99_00900300 [Aphelenchoides fujianensis]|nr:hypothetical protein M3Y99_00900300 [Aphelenchoides fujianensis]
MTTAGFYSGSSTIRAANWRPAGGRPPPSRPHVGEVENVRADRAEFTNIPATAADPAVPFVRVVRLPRAAVVSMTTQFTKLFAFILANVHDPSPPFDTAYRMQCYSCMSPYLEDQFVFISHLYRKPLSFTDKCDRNNFDWQAVQPKNCSDLCVTLRMNDKVGGRRRNGYMRGCMSDIKFYNRSVLYYGDAMRGGGGSTHQTRCQLVRLRDLFAAPDWYGFDPNDHVELCTCHAPFCNSAHSPLGQSVSLVVAGVLGTTLMFDWIFPTRRKP